MINKYNFYLFLGKKLSEIKSKSLRNKLNKIAFII